MRLCCKIAGIYYYLVVERARDTPQTRLPSHLSDASSYLYLISSEQIVTGAVLHLDRLFLRKKERTRPRSESRLFSVSFIFERKH